MITEKEIKKIKDNIAYIRAGGWSRKGITLSPEEYNKYLGDLQTIREYEERLTNEHQNRD